MRTLLRAALVLLLMTGCDSPSIPLDTGQYDYRLLVVGGGARTFHWPLGAEVPVFVNDPDPSGRPSLSQALDRAGDAWTQAALFGEARLRKTENLAEAVAVLQWKDTEPILSTPVGCSGPSTGAAFTRGCLNEGADSLRTWPRRDGEASRVLFTVVVEIRADLDQEFVDLLVTHEGGHVLGILNHSGNPQDLMWGGVLQTDQTTSADRQTLRTLYQSPVDLSY